MKLKKLHPSRKGEHYKLVLEVYIKEGRDLVHGLLASTCNPVACASLSNCNQGLTRKLKHTTRPFWNSKVKLKLYEDPTLSTALRIVVYDVQKRQPLEYLGELRINLRDIRFGSDYQWLKLYSAQSEKRYVTGSVYVNFELKKRKRKLKRAGASTTSLSTTDSGPPSQLVSLWDSYLGTIDPLDESLADLTVTDDQGFYKDDVLENYISRSDLEEEDDDEILGHVLPDDVPILDDLQLHSDGSETDISAASFTDENKELDLSSYLNRRTQSSDTIHLQVPKHTQLKIHDSFNGSLTDLETTDNTGYSPSLLVPDGSAKSRRFRIKSRRKKKSNYQFSSTRQILGVIFLEIISAEGLPPFKSATRTGFDMDPFVIVSFGRKVYRSSWRKHTLSPVFNERLAFEVQPFEKNYEIQFNVLDRDHFSFHDNVGTAKIPVVQLMDDSELDNSLQEENPTLTLIDAESDIALKRKKKLIGRNPERNVNKSITDCTKLRTFNLSLTMNHSVSKLTKQEGVYTPTLKIRARFEAYDDLRREFWMNLLSKYDEESLGHMDVLQLEHFLGTIGSSLSDATLQSFFTNYKKNPWSGETLTFEEIIENFESLTTQKEAKGSNGTTESGHFFEVPVCPICDKKRLSNKNEVDIITHVAICASRDWSTVNKLLRPSFASRQMATKRWYSKVLIKLTYGKYGIGRNSANILVQDRNTGLIMEEKMSVYVRLGIKLFYRSFFDKAIDKKKMKKLLRNLSIKQGAKFDSPSSQSQIASFIQFHQLDLSECRVQDISSFKTFNQFFYRRLVPGARPLETDRPLNLCSPCDSRCTVFENVSMAKDIWIKGKEFSIEKLLYKNGQGYSLPENELQKYANGCIGVFRLAPQDYHRFHSPCDGIVGKPMFIDGEYYTVNPMAIRSELDVFGDNVRCIIPIETVDFGTVIMIPVGAMMVGSILVSVEEGEEVSRGDEIGYFKFGGSTIILLFENGVFQFDSDLLQNSKESIETLIRVGMSLGHAPGEEEFQRVYHDFNKQTDEHKLKIIRSITGGPGISGPSMGQINDSLVKKLQEQQQNDDISLKELSWEAYNMTIDEEDEHLLQGLDLDDIPLDSDQDNYN